MNLLKEAFATALLYSPHDPFRAAQTVFGHDTFRAVQASIEWPSDPYVLIRQAELLAQHGEDAFLPSRTVILRKLFEMADDIKTDKKDKLAALKLYAEISNMMPKSDGIAINNTINNNKVMVIKDYGTDAEWEERAKAQQAKLITDART